jgi:hypothetical protein
MRETMQRMQCSAWSKMEQKRPRNRPIKEQKRATDSGVPARRLQGYETCAASHPERGTDSSADYCCSYADLAR